MRWRAAHDRPPTPTRLDEPVRIALYAGIFVHFDAVSTSLLHKLEILRRRRARARPIEITVFTQGTVYSSSGDRRPRAHPRSCLGALPSFKPTSTSSSSGSLRALRRHQHAAPEAPDTGRRPQHHASGVGRLARSRANAAPQPSPDGTCSGKPRVHEQQRARSPTCSTAASPRDAVGTAPATGLFVRRRSCRRRAPRICPRTDPTAVVGRFVRAKGVHDLLRAMAALLEDDDVCLTLVGDVRFSDRDPRGSQPVTRSVSCRRTGAARVRHRRHGARSALPVG